MDAPAHQSPGWHLWQVPTTTFDERMSNIEFHSHDVQGDRAFSEGVASGRCPVDQHHRPGRYPVTADQRQKRLGWTKEDKHIEKTKDLV